MKPKIIISGYHRLISQAKAALEEFYVPESISIDYVDAEEFLANYEDFNLNPSKILVCGSQSANYLAKRGISAIPIRVTALELAKAIEEVRVYQDEVPFLTYYEAIQDIDQLKPLLNIPISQTTFSNYEELLDILKEFKMRGIKAVAGASRACSAAIEQGFIGAYIYSDEQVRQAIKQAINIVSAYLSETERAEMLKAILDYAQSGIIGTDHNFKVTTFNPSAQKILGMPPRAILGKRLQDVSPILELDVNNRHQPKINIIEKIRGRSIVFSSLPIKVDNNVYGQVTVLHDTRDIRKVEAKIRKDLYQKRFPAQREFSDIVGNSDKLTEMIQSAKIYANSNSSVLIFGETGTGKELFAQSIHNASPRKNNPFVSINCGALTESLLDSELFGYEKGSFTGARHEGKLGLFEMGHLGTIFLDEISEIRQSVQVRLLRVLQERQVMRIGGDRLIPIDVRVISATNRDLWELVEAGKFREDLYYRLNVLELSIPPLRERPEDIRLITEFFFKEKAPQLLHAYPNLAEKFLPELSNYSWPGNIRELENILERFTALAQQTAPDIHAYRRILQTCIPSRQKHKPLELHFNNKNVAFGDINRALNDLSGNKSMTARTLGISRTTLYRKIKKNGGGLPAKLSS